MEKKDTLVIELHGGPGVGKTTIGLGLTALLKLYLGEYTRSDLAAEYVSEFAKEIALEEYSREENCYHQKIKNQALLFGTQLERLLQLNKKINFIVNDSPLLLCAEYAPKEYYPESAWLEIIRANYSHFSEIIHVYIKRNDQLNYLNIGRLQNLDQAKIIDDKLSYLLFKYCEVPLIVTGDILAPYRILGYLIEKNLLPKKEGAGLNEFVEWYKLKLTQALYEL